VSAQAVRAAALLASLCVTTVAHGDTAWVERIVTAYRFQTPISAQPGLDFEAATAIQRRVAAELEPDYGAVFGYKSALTSPAAQERFGVDRPVLGTLLKDMVLDNGSRISASKGVRLLVEADLLVRVADPRINQARTRAEAFAAIDRVAAFVEVADVIIEPGQPVTGPLLTAINAGARFGVMGPALATEGLAMADLSSFSVTLFRNGKAVAPAASGTALMGDPLNVVLWMVEEARRREQPLQSGDWLSLGSLSPPVRGEAGDRYRAVYRGLGPGPLEVAFELVP